MYESQEQSVEEQQKRQARVQGVCDRNSQRLTSEIIPDKFSNILVDDTHKLLYCVTPKVACTNWKRILLMLSGKVNVTDPNDLPASMVHGEFSKYLRTLSTYSPEEIEHRVEKYYKFMFVRNPMERLLSAYHNKFTLKYNTYFHKAFGTKIIKRYRQNATKDALENGTGVKFNEFVQYLLDPVTTSVKPFNEHWRQFYQLCRPCLVNYDFIGKYETISEDTVSVLNQLELSDLLRFPTKPSKKTQTVNLLSTAYKDISSEDVHRLWELYKVDFAMFGYEYPDTSLSRYLL